MDDLRTALSKPDNEIEFGGIKERKRIESMYDRAQAKRKQDLMRKYVLEEHVGEVGQQQQSHGKAKRCTLKTTEARQNQRQDLSPSTLDCA